MNISIEKMNESIASDMAWLESEVKHRNAMKLYDINKYSETIYCDLLNEAFGWNLVQANTPTDPNCKGVDLIDDNAKIFVQVSSDATKQKVEHTIEKVSDQSKYDGFKLYFLFVSDKSKDIDFRSIQVPGYITCGSDCVLYPADLTKQVQGRDFEGTRRMFDLLQKHLHWQVDAAKCAGGEVAPSDHKGADQPPPRHPIPEVSKHCNEDCFCFVARVASLCKSVDHVKDMCEEYMEDPQGKKMLDDVLLKRINYQVSNHIPNRLPDLTEVRKIWAGDTQIYGALLEIRRLVFEIDCAGRDDCRMLDVGEVKRLVDELLTDIYNTIRAMCKETGISEGVAFTELSIWANEI